MFVNKIHLVYFFEIYSPFQKKMFIFICQSIVAIGCLYILKEYYNLYQYKGNLNGPSFVWPIFGSVFEMILHPFEFYEKQKTYGPISWNSIVGSLFIYTRDPDLTKKVFANEEGKLRLWLHMNAEKILGKNNIAFMSGEPHKVLRRELIHLFTKKALGKYLSIQEDEIRSHMKNWQKYKPQEIRILARNLNVDTSIHVFTGTYMNENVRNQFRQDYMLMNEGLLAFPINFPGTKLYKAIEARKRIINVLIPIIQESQNRMQSYDNATCLVDEWMKIVVSKPKHERETDNDYAFHILDFLFASQDASTSSLVWVFELLSRHPDIWKTIKEEQDLLRPNDERISLELLDKMDYNNQFVKELLRYSAPAVSVPHIALEDFKLTEDYTVPKGGVVFPSILWAHSTEDGFKNCEKFDPSRWSPERREESSKYFLAFGYGSHKCLGQEYAQNHLKAFVAILVKNWNWKRILTSKSNKIDYFPTITPADGCIIQFY